VNIGTQSEYRNAAIAELAEEEINLKISCVQFWIWRISVTEFFVLFFFSFQRLIYGDYRLRIFVNESIQFP